MASPADAKDSFKIVTSIGLLNFSCITICRRNKKHEEWFNIRLLPVAVDLVSPWVCVTRVGSSDWSAD